MILETKRETFLFTDIFERCYMKKIILALIILVLFCSCGVTKPTIVKESHKFGTGDIWPVVYYEDLDIGIADMLSREGRTHTFRIENGEAFELEKHYRTWGRTYPGSAMERFTGYGFERADYGQLLIYYKTAEEEVFLFDNIISENNYEYSLIVNEKELKIPYDSSENFVNLLHFDGCYYLIGFGHNEKFIRVHRISDSLDEREVFDIGYEDIPTVNIMYGAIAVAEDVMIIPTGGLEGYNLIRYDFKTAETKIIPSEYGIWGLVANGGRFQVIGFTENYEVVFDTIGTDGISISKTVEEMPMELNATRENFSHEEVFYMYQSEIYCNFYADGKYCFASYDIESGDWTNVWALNDHEEYRGPGDIKFMIKEENEYYDIFPNTNS